MSHRRSGRGQAAAYADPCPLKGFFAVIPPTHVDTVKIFISVFCPGVDSKYFSGFPVFIIPDAGDVKLMVPTWGTAENGQALVVYPVSYFGPGPGPLVGNPARARTTLG